MSAFYSELRAILLTAVRARLRAAPDKVVCLRNTDVEIKPAPGDSPEAMCELISAECTTCGIYDFDFAGVPVRMVCDCDAYLNRNTESGALRLNKVASYMFDEDIYGDVYLQARVENE